MKAGKGAGQQGERAPALPKSAPIYPRPPPHGRRARRHALPLNAHCQTGPSLCHNFFHSCYFVIIIFYLICHFNRGEGACTNRGQWFSWFPIPELYYSTRVSNGHEDISGTGRRRGRMSREADSAIQQQPSVFSEVFSFLLCFVFWEVFSQKFSLFSPSPY